MKATLELPDELLRAVKIRAAREDRTLKDLIAELLQRGLEQEPPDHGQEPSRVQLPLVTCAHPARPGAELTPERLAQALAEQEAGDLSQ